MAENDQQLAEPKGEVSADQSAFPAAPTFSPPAGPTDLRAKQEAAFLAQGKDLEEDGKEQEHRRHQSFRNHINAALICLFWIIAVSLIFGVLIYVWHIITPDKWKFLSEKGFDKLQTLLGSAILSSALSGYVKQRMD